MPPFEDDLTAEELAYMESGGKTVLPVTPAPAPSEPVAAPAAEAPVTSPAPVEPAAPVTDPAKAAAPADTSDDDDDDEIDEGEYVKDAQGRLRDPKTNRFVKTVPYHAVHKVREKHKATKAELEQLRIQMARGEERLAILNEAFNGQQKPAEPAQAKTPEPNPFDEANIDPMQDFVGAMEQLNRRNGWLAQQHKRTEERTAHVEQQSQQRDAMTVLRQTYHSDVQSFRQQTPDFMDAYQHLVKGRLAELELQGVRDPLKRKAIVEQEETQLVAQAMQNNQSPAQLIYGVAKARGYAGKPAVSAPSTTQPAPAAAAAPNAAAEKIRQIQNGQQAAQTLSTVGGQAAPSLTYESLARMSQEEFDAVADKMSEKDLMRFLGGR